MDIITIDPSIRSTAIVINGNPHSFAVSDLIWTKTNRIKKWFDITQKHIELHTIYKAYDQIDLYSDLEVAKIDFCRTYANNIAELLDKQITNPYNSIALIEGYSYSSASGPIIDLVALGTIIRNMLCDHKITFIIMPPSSVKKMAARLTYPAVDVGKRKPKIEYRNNEGVMGGSFTKHDIYKSLTENNDLQTDWVNFLRIHEDEILESKSIPKPIEDINDSMVMYHILEKLLQEHDDVNDAIEKLTTTF